MTELMLSLLLVGVGGVVWAMRDNSNPTALWVWGWVLVGGTIALLQFGDEVGWARNASHLLSPLLPGFVLAGALVYSDRRSPRWLLPAALCLGAVRWGAATAGLPRAGNWAGLILEPAVYLGAAWLVFRAHRGEAAAIAQRILPLAFVSVAAVEFATAWSVITGLGLRTPASSFWAPVALATLGLQVTAAGHRARWQRRHLEEENLAARRALEHAEKRLHVLAEHSSDVIFESDTSGRITYVSPSVETVMGITEEAIRNAPPFSFTHPDDRDHGSQEHFRALDTDEQTDLLLRTRHGDGSWRWIETKMRSFVAPDGERRIVGISRDVTERQQQQEALERSHESLEQRVSERTRELLDTVAKLEREVATRKSIESQLRDSRSRYRAVSDLSSDFAFGLRLSDDGRVRIQWMSDAFERLTGYAPSSIEGEGWRSIVTPDHWRAAASHVDALRACEPVEFEGFINTADGERIYLHTRLSATRSSDALELVGASRDITARRSAEDERRELERHIHEIQRLESLGVLAGGIAHDFNNLLSVILGNSSLALADVGENAPAAQRLHRIRAAAQHAAGLTEQMLTYSGRTPTSLKPVDLSDVIHEIADLLRAALDKKVTLAIDTSQGPAPMDGDVTQLRQVAINLVTNAGEAIGDARGTVNLSAGTSTVHDGESHHAVGTPPPPPGEYTFLEVADTGSGMDEATSQRIFEPFFTTRHSGRGLGLAAVLGIVQGHRGHILVASTPGTGTTFRVLFPRSAETSATVPAPTERHVETSTGRILLVDDEPLVLEVGAEFLKRAGYEVITCASGRDAIARVGDRDAPVDAIVLDLVMPDLDGQETLREVRKTHPQLPVVLTSGYDESRSGDRAADRHASFLRKPYEPDDLIACVARALKRE